MTWFRVENNWHSHPKMLALSRDARLLFIDGLSYCSQHLTDGFIPREALGQITPGLHLLKARIVIKELIDAGLWSLISKAPATPPLTPPPTGGGLSRSCHVNHRSVPGGGKAQPDACAGWQIHDYLEYQTPRSSVESARAQARERQRKCREHKVARHAVTAGVTDPSSNPIDGTIEEPCHAVTNSVSHALVTTTDTDTDQIRGIPPVSPPLPARLDPDGGQEPKPSLTLTPPEAPTTSAKPKRPRKPRESKARIPCPPGWAPTASHFALGKKLGFEKDRIEREAEDFQNHHTARGNVFADWDAAFRTWLSNAPKFDEINRKRGEVVPLRGNGKARVSSVQRSGWEPPESTDPALWETPSNGEF